MGAAVSSRRRLIAAFVPLFILLVPARLPAQNNSTAAADAQAAAEAQRQAELNPAKQAQLKAEAAAEATALEAEAEAAKEDVARASSCRRITRATVAAVERDFADERYAPGLVVRMADVLFETGKYAISMDARLKLAKLSGIIQAHPHLNLALEGYTDNTGTPDFNLKLSRQPADAVRQFLISQGLSPNAISSDGLGQADPVADNNTAAGRKQNRRLEIIVSSKVIGGQMGK
ncbi:MAG TPA: OmpA family protein [Candidatus Acidoferrum sp.]|nr:OmpA family protein [Candidatus Acidoferrum sp.]